MKRIITYLLIVLCGNACAQKISSSVSAQSVALTDSFKLLTLLPGSYTNMEVDGVGNLYLLTSGNQLKKFSSQGDSVAVFNDVRRFGNVSYIDVSNPLRPLVYYKNFSTVVLLDRLLTVRTTLNLRKVQIFRVNAITTSYDNNLWIFDEQDFKLKKITEEGRVLLESIDPRLSADKTPSPLFIADTENFIYLYDPIIGLIVFDQYTAYKNTIPLTGWNALSVSNNRIFGLKGNTIIMYDPEKKDTRSFTLPSGFSNASAIRAAGNKVYVLDKEGVRTYLIP